MHKHPTKARDGVLLIFAKAPIPGHAKTRLIPALGAEGAAALQQHLLDSTLTTSEAWSCGARQLWCSPDTSHPAFTRGAELRPITLHRQLGADLGARMAHAFEQALERYSWAIIIGTDCPELGTDDLQQAADLLRQGTDAVIGPAGDGGYYLLGLRRFDPGLFNDMVWGGSEVLAETLQRLQQLGMITRKLVLKHDLDRPEDLHRFPQLPLSYLKGTC